MWNLCNPSPYAPSMTAIDHAIYNALMADFKLSFKHDFGSAAQPSTPPPSQPVPSSYGVNNDLRRVARETLDAQVAQKHLENIEGGLAEAKEAVEDRRLIEKALKATARLERRNVAIRRFALAYRAISGGSIVTLAGIEFGNGGKVHVGGSGYPFANTHDSLGSLRRAALAKGYYVAVSYVDKD